MKKNRHDAILSIIKNNCVEKHEQLAEMLADAGFPAAQATISRDMRDLRITKITDKNGRQRYIALGGELKDGGDYKNSERTEINPLHSLDDMKMSIRGVVTSVDYAGNLLVFKTRTGMGMAVAVNIDTLRMNEIIGTIAGDDVVFCAVKTAGQAEKLKDYFDTLIFG